MRKKEHESHSVFKYYREKHKSDKAVWVRFSFFFAILKWSVCTFCSLGFLFSHHRESVRQHFFFLLSCCCRFRRVHFWSKAAQKAQHLSVEDYFAFMRRQKCSWTLHLQNKTTTKKKEQYYHSGSVCVLASCVHSCLMIGWAGPSWCRVGKQRVAMVTVKGEGGGCVCGAVLFLKGRWQAERWGSVPWSCAITAAHPGSALLLRPAPSCLSCCHLAASRRPGREQILNSNEAAEGGKKN